MIKVEAWLLLSGRSSMDLEQALVMHLAVCDEVHRILCEETSILEKTGRPPDEEFLNKKRSLLPKLSDSLGYLGREKFRASGEVQRNWKLFERLQQRLMGLMLLDRENERLLLKTLVTRSAQPVVKTSPETLQRTYGQRLT